VTGAIIPSNLEVASIFTEAETENSLGYHSIVFHHVEKRFKHVFAAFVALASHAQDTICFLSVEKFGFTFDAPECVEEVVAKLKVVAEEELIFDDVAIIKTSLSVTLVKSAVIMVSAAAIILPGETVK
jgi:hypothetical protein